MWLPLRSSTCSSMVDTCRPALRIMARSGVSWSRAGRPTVISSARAATVPAFLPRTSTVPASFGTAHTNAGSSGSGMGFTPSERPFSSTSTESQFE